MIYNEPNDYENDVNKKKKMIKDKETKDVMSNIKHSLSKNYDVNCMSVDKSNTQPQSRHVNCFGLSDGI